MRAVDFSALFDSEVPPVLALIKLFNPDTGGAWYFTNAGDDIDWEHPDVDGGRKNTYMAVLMSYKPPSSSGGIPQGGSLEIDIDIQDDKGNELLRWFDVARDKAWMQAVAVIEDGEISPIALMAHHHGTVTWDGKKISWNIGWDDRLQMQINPVQFDFDSLTE